MGGGGGPEVGLQWKIHTGSIYFTKTMSFKLETKGNGYCNLMYIS